MLSLISYALEKVKKLEDKERLGRGPITIEAPYLNMPVTGLNILHPPKTPLQNTTMTVKEIVTILVDLLSFLIMLHTVRKLYPSIDEVFCICENYVWEACVFLLTVLRKYFEKGEEEDLR